MSSDRKPGARLRGWKARLVVVLLGLSPFLLFEIVLRIIGYGPDLYANFAPDARIFRVEDGTVRLKEDYAHVFRTRPFPAEKPAGTVRIFAVGDSVTHGWTCLRLGEGGMAPVLEDPWPARLEAALRARRPGVRFEVLNCGGLAHASYRLLPLVREVLSFSPDLVVVMTGSTEYVEARAYKDWAALEEEGLGFLRHWRTLTLARDLLRRSRAEDRRSEAVSERPVEAWAVTEKDEVRGPEEVRAVIEHGAHNVRLMAEACREAGVPLVLCTAPSDLRYPPHFRSREILHEDWRFVNYEGEETRTHFKDRVADVLRGEEGRFVRMVEKAVHLNEAGAHDEALSLVDEALPEMAGERRIAVLHYCRGVALDGLGRYTEAREAYEKARDLDLLPQRTFGALNDAFRRMAGEPGVHVADVEAAFAAAVPDGIPDGRLFFDNCHPRPEGHAIIAKTVLETILETR